MIPLETITKGDRSAGAIFQGAPITQRVEGGARHASTAATVRDPCHGSEPAR